MKILTIFDVKKILRDRNISATSEIFWDSHYVRPSKSWLFGPFQSHLAGLYTETGYTKWSENRRDCDKFTRRAVVEAFDLHALTAGAPDAGLALGLIGYQSIRGPHAIVIAIVERNEVVFFEPQRAISGSAQIKPTEEELNICYALEI